MIFMFLLACDIPAIPHFAGGNYQPGPDSYPDDIAVEQDTIGDLPSDSVSGEVCMPNCYARSCGPDGCGGICGVCPDGTSCSYDHSTCIPKSIQNPYGGDCLPNEYCKPYLKNSSVAGSYYKNYDWPQCLNDQCKDGPCWNYKCTQTCTNRSDTTASAGPSTDCPSNTKCVPWSSAGVCLPDADYTPCQTGDDCAAGEFCTPLPLQGEWQLACTPPWGDGVLGDPCNDDPDNGTIRTCQSGICMDKICSVTCITDADCLPPGTACKDGQCPDGRTCTQDIDCGPFKCQSVSLQDNSSFNVCLRKTCNTDADCPTDYYCRPAIWSQGYSNRCEHRHSGGLGYGNLCDVRHPCTEKALCLNGKCTKLCAEDTDCPFGMCTIVQQRLFSIVPYMGSTTVPFAACDPIKGSLEDCTSDADCSGEACRTVTVLEKKQDNPPVPTAKSICVTPETGSGTTGSQCGPAFHDQFCISGLCMDSNPAKDIAGYCAAPCVNQQDCPGFMAVGQEVFKTVCNLQPILTMGTPNPLDDVLAGVCQPVPRESSLQDCSSTLTCSNSEICRPYIQDYPNKQTIKLYCTTPSADDTMPGQACDPWNNTVRCATDICLPGQLPKTGICSMPCTSDSQCKALDPSLTCVSRPLLPALTDLKLSVCSPPALCTACMDDSDCMAGYGCVNINLGSWPTDYRCMPICTKPDDCQAHGQGTSCLSLPSPAGNSGDASHNVCTGIVCP